MKMKNLLLVIAMLLAFPANASEIPEGAIVKTANNPDVYIIKYNAGKQYKRLVLNPQVFKSYGHLKWENILTISDGEMNAFITSDLVRVDGQSDIYKLYPNGDTGNKLLLSSTNGYDLSSVYTINSVDFGNYKMGGTVGAVEAKVETPVVVPVVKPVATPIIKTVDQEIREKEERQKKCLAAMEKLGDMITQAQKDMNVLSIAMNEKQIEINSFEGQGRGIPLSLIQRQQKPFIDEYNALADKYNSTLSTRNRMKVLIDMIYNYAIYDTPIASYDITFLNSLGIRL